MFSCIFEKTPENVFISKNIFKCLVAFLKKFQKLSSRVCIPENDIENIFSITFPYFSHLPSTYIIKIIINKKVNFRFKKFVTDSGSGR